MSLSFFSLVLLCSIALAEEKAAEGGEGGEGAAVQESFIRPDIAAKKQKEFNDKSARLKMLEGRISSDEHTLMTLVHQKNAEHDPAKQKVIMDQMVAVVSARNKSVDEHMVLKSELQLRFPSQGEDLERMYRTQTRKTLEDIEGSAGLDELLSRTKKMVDKKYAPFNPEKPLVVAPLSEPSSGHSKRSGHKPAGDEEGKPKRLRFER